MNEKEKKHAAFLAAIAEQGGADEELDAIIFAPRGEVVDTGLHDVGEGINVEPLD